MTARVLPVIGLGAVLRMLAVVGITPTVYVDSIEYREVALLGGERRPWTVPLVYVLVGDSTARVVFHGLLGAAAWGALAYTVAELVRDDRVKVGAAATVMAMALVAPIANYDTTITSESVAISLLVGLLAALLRFVDTPTLRRAATVLAVAVPFAFTRSDHPLLVTAAAALAAFVAVRGREQPWRVLAAGLVVVSAWSWYAAGRNDEIARFNLALVVANRVVPHAGHLDWFTDRGMPLPDGVEPVTGLVGGDTVLAFADDDEWNEWAGDSGQSTYVRWLVANPDHLFLDPWPDLFGLRPTTLEDQGRPTVLLAPDDRYGRLHQVLPQPVEALLWGGSDAAPVILAGAGLAVVAVRRREGLRQRLDPPRLVAGAALVLGVGHVLLGWHASPIELGRHAMIAATTIHLALLVLVAVTLDRALSRGSEPQS